jgi:putative proteasome-type protease
MTFCLGMNLEEGLVGIADTRVLSGSEVILARKVSVYQQQGQAMFLMTSGLRSLRDKAVTYFEDAVAQQPEPLDRLFKAVNLFTAQLKRVAREDKESLEASGLPFEFNALIGGQFTADQEHKLYLAYPQGNWVEVGRGTPYHIIGASGYGKPILDRTLKYQDPMRFALKVGCLAFDSTRISAAGVDFPIDIVLYRRGAFKIIEHRYEKDALQDVSVWWQDRLRRSVNELPSEWIESAFSGSPSNGNKTFGD